jgi:hypothetical protein
MQRKDKEEKLVQDFRFWMICILIVLFAIVIIQNPV